MTDAPKPFPHEAYWNAFAHQTQGNRLSDCGQYVLRNLPKRMGGATIVVVGTGGAADESALVLRPEVSQIHTYDAASEPARIIGQRKLAIAQRRMAGDKAHYANLTAHTMMMEDMQGDAVPMNDATIAETTLFYAKQDKVLPVTEYLLSRLNVGGIFAANFAGQGTKVGADHPPIACVTADELKQLLAAAGCQGTVKAYGEHARPLKKGEVPVMFEVLAVKRAPGS